MRQKIILCLIIVVSFILFPAGMAELEIHYLDVGEADCTILLCDGETMVIDGGNAEDSSLVYSYIKNNLGLSRIEYVVATHPHEDHVGGLAGVMNACRVDRVYSICTHYPASERFTTFMKYVDLQNTEVRIPHAGDMFSLGGAVVEVLSPMREHERLNDDSIVLRIVYGSTAFLFEADAEREAEQDMLASGLELQCDVLRVAHHGGGSSSSAAFLKEAAPRFAVISTGKDNDFNHPNAKTLERLEKAGAMVLRTDLLGTIVCVSDGSEIMFRNIDTPETVEYETPYLGNINSMKLHRRDCEYARKISPSNRMPVETLEEGIEAGLDMCGVCKPDRK